MKIQPGYVLRKVMDIYVIVGIGRDAYAPDEIMSLNGSGAFLWGFLEQGTDRDDLIGRLEQEYDVDHPTACRDVDAFLARLRERSLICE